MAINSSESSNGQEVIDLQVERSLSYFQIYKFISYDFIPSIEYSILVGVVTPLPQAGWTIKKRELSFPFPSRLSFLSLFLSLLASFISLFLELFPYLLYFLASFLRALRPSRGLSGLIWKGCETPDWKFVELKKMNLQKRCSR